VRLIEHSNKYLFIECVRLEKTFSRINSLFPGIHMQSKLRLLPLDNKVESCDSYTSIERIIVDCCQLCWVPSSSSFEWDLLFLEQFKYFLMTDLHMILIIHILVIDIWSSSFSDCQNKQLDMFVEQWKDRVCLYYSSIKIKKEDIPMGH